MTINFNNSITKKILNQYYKIYNIRKVFGFYKENNDIITFQIIILKNNEHNRLKLDIEYQKFTKLYLKTQLLNLK